MSRIPDRPRAAVQFVWVALSFAPDWRRAYDRGGALAERVANRSSN